MVGPAVGGRVVKRLRPELGWGGGGGVQKKIKGEEVEEIEKVEENDNDDDE